MLALSDHNPINRILALVGRSEPSAPVQVGDRFEELAVNSPQWEVDRIRIFEASTYPLVILKRIGAPHLERALSIHALSDREVYKPTLEAVPHIN